MRRERHRATTRDRVDRQPAAYANKTRKSIACHAMDQSDHGRRTRANAARTKPTRGTGGARRPPDQPVHRDCLPIPRDEARLVSSRRPSHRGASPGNRSVLHPSPVQSAPQHLRSKITTAENRCASAPRDALVLLLSALVLAAGEQAWQPASAYRGGALSLRRQVTPAAERRSVGVGCRASRTCAPVLHRSWSALLVIQLEHELHEADR